MRRHAEIGLAYALWAERLVAEGWSPYLMTFMFEPIGGSSPGVAQQMEREVERVYATLLTRVVRKPGTADLDTLPVWFCCLDRPVFKRDKASRSEAVVNDGQHVHAAVFIPPWSRQREDLVTHLSQNVGLYVRREYPLDRIDAVPITRRVGYVTGYVRKHTGCSVIGEDASFVLPRTLAQARCDAA